MHDHRARWAPTEGVLGPLPPRALPSFEEPVRPRREPLEPILCFSHLRWNFVFQRPQHLMVRFARERRVFFIEEPVFGLSEVPRLERREVPQGVTVLVPFLPADMSPRMGEEAQRALIQDLARREGLVSPLLWFYTPMMLPLAADLRPSRVVYDCMDELTGFLGAPPELVDRETELFQRADVVFTGGHSLYEAKRDRHPNVHAFPSGIDVAHFARARGPLAEPEDQARLPGPRVGHYAVIDERLDRDLVDGIAAARPEWQLVLVGPVVKIDPGALPRRPNIHWLGAKTYEELPHYLHGWDATFMPFTLDASTRYISPTKTPEYLASGRPVVSTPIADVVRTYGTPGLVRIASTVDEFVAALEVALRERDERSGWMRRVDRTLARMSWERTWSEMKERLR